MLGLKVFCAFTPFHTQNSDMPLYSIPLQSVYAKIMQGLKTVPPSLLLCILDLPTLPSYMLHVGGQTLGRRPMPREAEDPCPGGSRDPRKDPRTDGAQSKPIHEYFFTKNCI